MYVCMYVFPTLYIGTWRYLGDNILPYIIDWLFVLILGILMACLSFILDFFISKITLGMLFHFQFELCIFVP